MNSHKRYNKFTVFVMFLTISAHGADTNVLVIPQGDKRAGAVFFVDECLSRGITNSISISDLRTWAINLIQLYQLRESNASGTNAGEKPYPSILAGDIPETIKTIQIRIPSCRAHRPESDDFEKLVESSSKIWSVSKEEASDRLRTIEPYQEPPKVSFYRSSQGVIQAVTIRWYIYGAIVGPESFKPDWGHEPWYQRKLADGVYLWHGYK